MRALAGLSLALLTGCGGCGTPGPGIWALEYGSSTLRASQLLPEGDRDTRLPVSWQVWVVRTGDRVVLVDTGIGDAELAGRWGIRDYRSLAEVLGGAPLHLDASEVTDVVLTHGHWDHVGGVGELPRARVWVQAEAIDWMRSRVSVEEPERSGVRLVDLEVLDGLQAAGRLELVEGTREIVPGVTVHGGGGHTPGVQWVSVALEGATWVLASDTAYLQANLSLGPPGGSMDAGADALAYEEMRALSPVAIVPGHEPGTVSGGWSRVGP